MDIIVIIGAIAILTAAFLYFRHLIQKSDAESADIIANGSIHDTPKNSDDA
jgi:hypothetical protein